MGERYWVSGAQLGVILAYLRINPPSNRTLEEFVKETLAEIQEKQFLGRIENSEMDKKKVSIVEEYIRR